MAHGHHGNNWTTDESGIVEPVTLAEAKTHLRITHADEDTYIESLISAARDWSEQYLALAIPQQTVTLKLDHFPANQGMIYLPFSNLLSVTSVAYLDQAGATQTVAATVYAVDTLSRPGAIYLKAGQTWPDDLADQHHAVTIVYEAGFAEAVTGTQDCPKAVKHAILLLVGHWFENRESTAVGVSIESIPLGVEACLDRYRLYGV